MKTLIIKMFLALFFFGTFSNAQDFINQFDGIPIIIGAPDNIYATTYDKMDEMGADFVITKDLTQVRLNEIKLRNLNFKIIPSQTKINPPNLLYNYIMSYTEGAYTRWEAEGTSAGKGDATLKYNHSICTTFVEGNRKGIVTLPYSGYDTLTTGPGYQQEIRYWRLTENRLDSINYTAEFNMKLSYYIPQQNLNPEDTLCIIQVTNSEIIGPPAEPYRDTVIFLRSKAIKRFEFTPDIWQSFLINYELTEVENITLESTSIQLPHSTNINFHSLDPINKNAADYIQFKVIWFGDQYSKLYVDNVILFDEKGKDLKTLPAAQQNIIDQATLSFNSLDNENYITAWFAIDEPETIDNYEPIRIVDSLLKDASDGKRGLWVSFPSSWNGRYYDSYLGTHGLYKSNEFLQRTGISPHQNNHPLYDYPFNQENINNFHPGDDYRDWNIKYLADTIMNRVNNWDPNFCMTLLCGRYDAANLFHDPLPHEMLYEANLKLLYGAKSLSLYDYFGRLDQADHTGLVIPTQPVHTYTSKWIMVRDILSPRLKGNFGKTLKRLTQDSQHLDINASNSYGFISHFSGNLECLPSISDYDLGFFTDSLSRDYFMVISRYYNDEGACPIFINLDEGCLYNNLVLTKYVADTTYNILRSDAIRVDLTRGDAELYRIYPVVRWGGSLLANDTTNSGEILYDDMTIESGATLTVNGTYNAKANITVKSGGKIIAGPNGKIIFDPGKKLIVEGSAEIKGTSTNRLALEFKSSTNQGVVIKAGASIDMQYCDIKYSQVGVEAEVGTEGIYISYSSFTNCTSTGILMLGDTQHNEATPIVSNCTFTNCSTGISAANYSEILINQNTVSNSYLGIIISSIPSAFIQGNVISGNSNGNNDGILVFNSGGYIRSNIVQNHVNGIRIGNSSPDIGGNILEENKSHGLYVGSGSIPNLVGHLQINPPLYFPLSGYNKIFNNGSGTLANTPGNDSQSEIYLSASNIVLREGCNEIRDDRTATPMLNTLLLMNGSMVGGGRQLDARNNYWGTTTPTNSRFGLLSVLITPYYGDPCPVPDGSGGSEEVLVLKTSSGEVVDSISAAEGLPENFTTLQSSYSEADNYFATGSVDLAKPLYEQIVSSNYSAEEKLPAYNKLYTIGNLTGEEENYFTALQNTFDEIANTETDTLLKKIYKQNSIKCDVSKEEYLTAISKFDNIIQQNPNSEEAVYAEIDIITNALNLDTTNSQLGKMGNGKYLVKGTSDYLSKLNDILQSKFGINSEEKEQIIPKEYSLYQNYPNPFNPVTTIKYDLPKDGLVSLEIFDILGRKITTLVEEYRTAGSYEQVFNASSLASGVYVYKLQAGDFISSKKMILLK